MSTNSARYISLRFETSLSIVSKITSFVNQQFNTGVENHQFTLNLICDNHAKGSLLCSFFMSENSIKKRLITLKICIYTYNV